MPVKQLKEKITEEIEGLSEAEIEKVIRMIHLVKTEFLKGKKKTTIENFERARGAWKDVDVEGIYKKLNEDWKKWKPAVSV